MKLYITSYCIPDTQVLADLLGRPLAGTRVALIPNAKDYYATRARRVKIRMIVEWLESLGFLVTVVDLNDFHHAPVHLAKKLTQADMLWVMGGNTFCLREAMRRSGFDMAVEDVVDAGVVFGGESAGACVAGTDLHGVELMDDAEFAEDIIWDGLRLIPYYVVPHADNPDCGAVVQRMIELRGKDPNVIVLNDNQAWVVNGDDAWKITGVTPSTIEA